MRSGLGMWREGGCEGWSGDVEGGCEGWSGDVEGGTV